MGLPTIYLEEALAVLSMAAKYTANLVWLWCSEVWSTVMWSDGVVMVQWSVEHCSVQWYWHGWMVTGPVPPYFWCPHTFTVWNIFIIISQCCALDRDEMAQVFWATCSCSRLRAFARIFKNILLMSIDPLLFLLKQISFFRMTQFFQLSTPFFGLFAILDKSTLNYHIFILFDSYSDFLLNAI